MPPQDPQYILRNSSGTRVGTVYGTADGSVAVHHDGSGGELLVGDDGATVGETTTIHPSETSGDATSTIQSALDSSAVVRLPAGSYSITATLDVGASRLIGAGMEQTTLSVDSQLDRAVSASSPGGRVADLHVAGNNNAIEGVGLQTSYTSAERVSVADITQWSTETSTAAGIVTLSSDEVAVRDCRVNGVHAPNSGVARGIRLGGTGSGSASVMGCRVHDVTPADDADGIVVQVDDGYSRVGYNYVTGAAKSSLKIQMPGGHTTAFGNILGWGNNAGPSIVRILDTSATFVGNILKQEDTGSAAIRIGDNAEHVAVGQNTVTLTNPTGTADGIRVRAGSRDVSVTGGTIDMNGGGRHGVYLGAATSVSVSGLSVDSPGERGMTIEGPTGAMIDGLSVHNAGAHGIFIGSGTGIAIGSGVINSTLEAVSDTNTLASVGTIATY